MLVIVFLLMAFVTTSVSAKTFCERNRIYCKMIKLRPDIDREWAMNFSNILYKKAKKYKIDPMISVAIAMQESSLGRYFFNAKTIIRPAGNCYENFYTSDKGKKYCVEDEPTDVGNFQFSAKTMEHYKIDLSELLNLEYEIEWHLKILKHKMKVCSDLKDAAWSCYHSFTPKFRKDYKKLVERYL